MQSSASESIKLKSIRLNKSNSPNQLGLRQWLTVINLLSSSLRLFWKKKIMNTIWNKYSDDDKLAVQENKLTLKFYDQLFRHEIVLDSIIPNITYLTRVKTTRTTYIKRTVNIEILKE